MKLGHYLKTKGETAADFARRADPPLSRSAISRLLSGERKPSLALTLQIKAMTAGKVGERDWMAKRVKPTIIAPPIVPFD